MSSILKALKKVEEERPEARDAESWSHRFDSGEAIRKQARRSWWLRSTIAVLCLSAFVFAGGWLLYGHWSLLKEGALRLGKTSSTSEPPGPIAVAVRPETDSPVVEVPPPEPQSPPSYPGATTVASSSLPPGRIESPPAEPGGPPVPPVREPLSADRPKESASVADTAGSLRSLDTRRFRLEAVVWSDNPESRFAVINGNIVRIGGSVGDVSVTAIERESVVVRSGDKTGELRFTHD